MSKRQWLILCGIIISVLPYLGIPQNLRNPLFSALGLLVVCIAYLTGGPKIKSQVSLPYSEHKSDPAILAKKAEPKKPKPAKKPTPTAIPDPKPEAQVINLPKSEIEIEKNTTEIQTPEMVSVADTEISNSKNNIGQ